MLERLDMPVRLNPRKLLLSKWTAACPKNKEKHFIVVRLVEPELPDMPIVEVEIEAVFSRRSKIIPWRQLADDSEWKQGWL